MTTFSEKPLKHCSIFLVLTAGLLLFFYTTSAYASDTKGDAQNIQNTPTEPLLERPLMERYVLDELKSLRQSQQAMHAEVVEKIADAKLESSDRAITYTTDTVNNIFFIITAAASILVLLGWRSLSEVKDTVERTVENKVTMLTQEYETRLNDLESKLKLRSEQILKTQQKVSEANQIHALWMRAGIEENLHEKISIYDQILEINSEDVEALTYKADALLELGETRWALSLSNRAVKASDEYAFSYWQRACAHAELNEPNEALADIKKAIELSPQFAHELESEKAFTNLRDNDGFHKLLPKNKDGSA